jgi:hypothetical protein
LRQKLAIFTAALVALTTAWGSVYGQITTGIGNTSGWHQLAIGGGGFVTGLQFHSDGTAVARTDSAGAYVRSNSSETWAPVVTHNSMPSTNSDNSFGNYYGVCEIVIAPNDSNRLYMYYTLGAGNLTAAYIYKSTDKGRTWTKTDSTGFPTRLVCNAADTSTLSQRLVGPKMVVNPQNKNVVYVGTPSNGVYKTTNGGTNWVDVSRSIIPAGASNQSNLFAFDPTDRTGDTLYVSSFGTGIYKCRGASTGVLSCSELNSAGMPTTFTQVVVDQNGTLWVLDDASGSNQGAVLRYLSGTWSTQVTSASTITGVAINPADANKVYAVDYHGPLHLTTNGQAASPTWVVTTGMTIASTKIPWLGNSSHQYLGAGGGSLYFDPSQNNTLYTGTGVGIFKINPPTTATAITWNGDETVGIENLSTTSGVSVPGGPLLLTAQDRAIWVVNSPSTYPSTYYLRDNLQTIDHGWGVTYSLASPTTNFLGNTGRSCAVKSTDAGASWIATSGEPSICPANGLGGNMVQFDAKNFVWNIAANGGPYFTNNGGTSWSACSCGGSSCGTLGWNSNYRLQRFPMAADDTASSTVLIHNDGTGSVTRGTWKSTTTSCALTNVNSTPLDDNGGPFALIHAPGVAGTFYAAHFANIHGNLPDGKNLWVSTDSGSTWSKVRNVQSLFAMTFGKTKPGSDGFPEFYCACWVSTNGGVTYSYGIWEAENLDSASPKWTNIDSVDGGFPTGNYDLIQFLAADRNTYGTIYGGFQNSGFFYRTVN